MKMLLATALTLVSCVATHADDLGQLIPPAVISDPAPDSVPPPRSAHARADADLLGVVLIDAWNVGATGDEFGKVSGAARAALVAREFDDIGNSLRGATATSTAEEILAHRADWNFMSWASDLTRRPL